MLLRSGDIDPPWGTSVMLATDTPSSITPAFSHIRISRSTLRSTHPPAHQPQEEVGVQASEEVGEIGVHHPPRPGVHSLRMISNAWGVVRLRLNPNEHGRKLASKIGSNSSLAAVCTTRSRTRR
jgi:hypothetical protein